MRRWLLRIFVLLILLVALAGAALQIVLATDLPRRIVLDLIRQETGLLVEASRLQTGWLGRTTLHDVVVRVPLHDGSLVDVPRMRLEHTALLPLLLTQTFEVHVAEIERPAVHLKPDERGVWNVLEAAEMLEQALRDRPPAPGPPPELPRLVISEATVNVAAPDGRTIVYAPVTIRGEPVDRSAWRFAVALAPQVEITGRVSPRAAWAHSVDFNVEQIRALIEPWLPEAPERLRVAGSWQGQVRGAELGGRLTFRELEIAEADVRGDVQVTLIGQTVRIEPDNLILALANAPARANPGDGATASAPADVARLISGRIETDGREVSISRLIVEGYDVRAQIDAQWSDRDEQGDARIKWAGGLPEFNAEVEGELIATASLPRVGRMRVDGTMRLLANAPEGELESDWTFAARGADWRAMTGSITASRLRLIGEQFSVRADGLDARLRATWPTIGLTGLTMPGRTLRGSGRINVETLAWDLSLDARNWPVPTQPDERMDLVFDAQGDAASVNVNLIRLAADVLEIAGQGRYQPKSEQPIVFDGRIAAVFPPDHRSGLAGDVNVDIAVRGSMVPLALTMDAHVTGRELRAIDRTISDLDIPLTAGLTNQRIELVSPGFTFLDGRWTLEGDYRFDRDAIRLDVDGTDISVARTVRLARLPIALDGLTDASLRLNLAEFDLRRLSMDGSWTVRDLKGEGLVAAHGRGSLRARDGRVRLHEMELTHGDGALSGTAWFMLDRPTQLHADLTASRWPIALPEPLRQRAPEFEITADGAADLRVDLAALTADGIMDLGIDLTDHASHIGRLDLIGTVAERTITLNQFRAQAFDGLLAGTGQIVLDPDHWLDSYAAMSWQDVDLAKLASHLPQHPDLAGISRGEVAIGRAEDPRAPEPIRMDLVMSIDEGRYGPVALGRPLAAEAAPAQTAGASNNDKDGNESSGSSSEVDTTRDLRVVGYLGQRRFMIQRSHAYLADGRVDLFGRVSRHDDEFYSHVSLELDGLDLDQIARLLELSDDPMPGRISGPGSAGGYLQPPHRLFGQARLSLTDSDLAAAPGFATLYSALNLDFAATQPTGRGEVVVRLEGDALEVSRLTYFNRGTDVTARLRIQNIWLGGDSPIDGLAGGTIRPLRDTRLPFVGDSLDRLIGAVQANAASVRISGTLDDTQATVIPFAEALGALGRIIAGTPAGD